MLYVTIFAKGLITLKKIYVLASSHMQYLNFCRNFELNPRQDACYISDDYYRLLGLRPDAHAPLAILEGWEYNKNYTVATAQFLNFFYMFGKFEPQFISKGEIYNENFVI